MRKIYVFLIISILSIGIFTNTFSATSTEKKLSTTKKITFDKKQIDEIIKKINTNIDLEVKKAENQKDVLIQGNFKAEYIRPKNYKTDTDKIIITISGKKYEIPGVYGEKERQIYLKEIKKGGCKDKDGKLTEPFSGDCSGLSDFSHFDSFSPSGYYVLYTIGSYGTTGSKLVDVKTGKISLKTNSMIIANSRTKDKKQFVFSERSDMGFGPELNITKRGNFPKKVLIQKDIETKGIYLDEKYIYTIQGKSGEECGGCKDKYLKIYDLKTLKEIFSKNISGEVLEENSNTFIDISTISEEDYNNFVNKGKISSSLLTIDKYYNFLKLKKLDKAYEMSTKTTNFDTFKNWYKNIDDIYIANIEEINNQHYKFLTVLTEKGAKIIYEVEMKADANKILFSSSEKWKSKNISFFDKDKGIKIEFIDGYEVYDGKKFDDNDGLIFFGPLKEIMLPFIPKFTKLSSSYVLKFVPKKNIEIIMKELNEEESVYVKPKG